MGYRNRANGGKETPGELENEGITEGHIKVTDMGATGACQ